MALKEPPIYVGKTYCLPYYAGEVVKIDDTCYQFSRFAAPDEVDAIDLDLDNLTVYDTCEECSAIPIASSSSEDISSLSFYDSSSSEDISSGGCDYADCYEFTFTNLDSPDYFGADQQYVENGTFNGYPAFQGQTDPDWWLLYGTLGITVLPFTGWLLQKSGSSPDTGGYTTLYGTTDCTEPDSGDRIHPCPEGGYCHGTSEGNMAKGCQPFINSSSAEDISSQPFYDNSSAEDSSY